ncbi:MAG: aminoacyl-tRNA hydrolase [Chloroflexota bacterium]|nr:aminoacyl-tRNA hydrolase [Chloroflexota bacterium]
MQRELGNTPPTAESPLLIVGLGNPGTKYAKNRHNIGFQCIDRLARAYNVGLVEKKKHKALLGKGETGGRTLILAKPLTFMNESGQAVQDISHWYRIPPGSILVIHDDLDLPVGKVRLRPGGSSGGHRGVRSIIAALGTEAFLRLRIGIGRPEWGDPTDYVLNDFDSQQEKIMDTVRDWVVDLVPLLLEKGMEEAMNAFNGKRAQIAGDNR